MDETEVAKTFDDCVELDEVNYYRQIADGVSVLKQ